MRTTTETDPLNHTTQFVYNELGQLTETIFHDGSSTKTSYNALGQRQNTTDQEGKVTEYFYDPRSRLEKVNFVGCVRRLKFRG